MVIFLPRVGTGSVRLELIERSQTSQIEEILVATFVVRAQGEGGTSPSVWD